MPSFRVGWFDLHRLIAALYQYLGQESLILVLIERQPRLGWFVGANADRSRNDDGFLPLRAPYFQRRIISTPEAHHVMASVQSFIGHHKRKRNPGLNFVDSLGVQVRRRNRK